MRLVAVAVATTALALPLALAPGAGAATYTVTKADDTADGSCDSDCSLREAVIAANANAGADTITLPAGAYRLGISGGGEDLGQTGDLDVNDDLTITGGGARTTSIDGRPGDNLQPVDRIFDIGPITTGITVSIAHLTITHGGASTANDDFGGAIENQGRIR